MQIEEPAEQEAGATILDLTELLQRSLKAGGRREPKASNEPATVTPLRRKPAVTKAGTKAKTASRSSAKSRTAKPRTKAVTTRRKRVANG
jgi:DNA end-binding protein Ku